MRTTLEVPNANCPACLNEAKAALLESPSVREVHLNASTGHVEIEHDLRDPTELTAILGSLRGWAVAPNGEVEMVSATPTITGPCRPHSTN
jgi:copper chaperone CopZ